MQDKKTLITIIVLLVISLGLSVIGSYRHFSSPKDTDEVIDDNPTKDFIYNNKLYFYQDGELLLSIDCENCTKASSTIDDSDYHTNSYKPTSLEINEIVYTNVGIYATSTTGINLIGLPKGNIINTYSKVKNYMVSSASQYLMYEENDKWGVLFLDFSNTTIVSEYDYIALPAHFNEEVLDTSAFIVKKDNTWSILKSDNTISYTTETGEITDFNDNYVIVYYNDTYHILDYNNNEYLAGMPKVNVFMVGNYVLLLTNNNTVLVYDDCSNAIKTTFTLPDYDSVYFSLKDNSITIKTNGNFYNTIEIS